MITTEKIPANEVKFSTLARMVIDGRPRAVVIEHGELAPKGHVMVSVIQKIGRQYIVADVNDLHQF